MSGFLCAIPVLASLLSGCADDGALAVGYVEGDYVNIAPVTAAELVTVDVAKGDAVIPGQLLARQDRADAEIALAEATAARDQAAAELANLREGSRPEEIAVTEASLASARVRLREAERTAERQSTLAGDGVISQALLDRDIAARDMAAADVTELEARLAVARLPARAQVVSPPKAVSPPPRPRDPRPPGGSTGARSPHPPPEPSQSCSIARAKSQAPPRQSSRSSPTAPSASWSMSANPTSRASPSAARSTCAATDVRPTSPRRSPTSRIRPNSLRR